jgi:hypothetical protein
MVPSRGAGKTGKGSAGTVGHSFEALVETPSTKNKFDFGSEEGIEFELSSASGKGMYGKNTLKVAESLSFSDPCIWPDPSNHDIDVDLGISQSESHRQSRMIKVNPIHSNPLDKKYQSRISKIMLEVASVAKHPIHSTKSPSKNKATPSQNEFDKSYDESDGVDQWISFGQSFDSSVQEYFTMHGPTFYRGDHRAEKDIPPLSNDQTKDLMHEILDCSPSDDVSAEISQLSGLDNFFDPVQTATVPQQQNPNDQRFDRVSASSCQQGIRKLLKSNKSSIDSERSQISMSFHGLGTETGFSSPDNEPLAEGKEHEQPQATRIRHSQSPTDIGVTSRNASTERVSPSSHKRDGGSDVGDRSQVAVSFHGLGCDIGSSAPDIPLAEEKERKQSQARRMYSRSPTHISVTCRDASIHSARQQHNLHRIIHLNNSGVSSSTSIVSSMHEASKIAIGFHSPSAASPTASEYKEVLDSMVETSSCNSALMSAVTASSVEDSQKATSPLTGAAREESELRIKFLKVAGPKLYSKSLTAEEREAIFVRALGAGIPEEFVNMMLDRAAFTKQEQEHPHGTMSTCESTEASSNSEHSLRPADSASSHFSLYTTDSDSIDYRSFRKFERNYEKANSLHYGCMEDLKSTFSMDFGGGFSVEKIIGDLTSSIRGTLEGWRKQRRARRGTV